MRLWNSGSLQGPRLPESQALVRPGCGFSLVELNMLGTQGWALCFIHRSRDPFCSYDFWSSFSYWVRSCAFFYFLLFFSLVPSSRTWKCFSNALLWKFVWVYCNLQKVPTIGLWGSILQRGTDLNWLLSEMPFCNTDEWLRGWNPVSNNYWWFSSVLYSFKNVPSTYLLGAQFTPADQWLTMFRFLGIHEVIIKMTFNNTSNI